MAAHPAEKQESSHSRRRRGRRRFGRGPDRLALIVWVFDTKAPWLPKRNPSRKMIEDVGFTNKDMHGI